MTLFAASDASAALVRIWPKLVAVFGPDFERVDGPLVPSATPYIAQIDILMTIDDLQPGQIGFGNAAFDIELRGNVSQSSLAPGWMPDTSTLDLGSWGEFIAKWPDNGDFGQSGQDLRAIIIGISPRQFSDDRFPDRNDPRRSLGIAPFNNPMDHFHTDGEYAGSLYVDFLADKSGAFGDIELIPRGSSYYDTDGLLSTTNMTTHGEALVLRAVPEPTSAALASVAIAVFALLLRPLGRA
jgi:hypothetical protein